MAGPSAGVGGGDGRGSAGCGNPPTPSLSPIVISSPEEAGAGPSSAIKLILRRKRCVPIVADKDDVIAVPLVTDKDEVVATAGPSFVVTAAAGGKEPASKGGLPRGGLWTLATVPVPPVPAVRFGNGCGCGCGCGCGLIATAAAAACKCPNRAPLAPRCPISEPSIGFTAPGGASRCNRPITSPRTRSEAGTRIQEPSR